jgi:hypothetical protein
MNKKQPKNEELDGFEIVETNSPLAKALRLTGHKGTVATFIVGPEGLVEVLTELNGLLVAWAEVPESVRKDASGPAHSLPASRIELAKGRDASEVALTIHAGPMQFVYLCPLEGFVLAALELLKKVRPFERPAAH